MSMFYFSVAIWNSYEYSSLGVRKDLLMARFILYNLSIYCI